MIDSSIAVLYSRWEQSRRLIDKGFDVLLIEVFAIITLTRLIMVTIYAGRGSNAVCRGW